MPDEQEELREAIERLRKSAARSDATDRERGLVAGDKWAKELAETKDLRALERCAKDDPDFLHFTDEAGDDYGAAPNFAATIGPAHEADDDYDPWEIFGMCGEPFPSDAYVEGLVDGALSFWRRVKASVEPARPKRCPKCKRPPPPKPTDDDEKG
jgi:hypothetical protein